MVKSRKVIFRKSQKLLTERALSKLMEAAHSENSIAIHSISMVGYVNAVLILGQSAQMRCIKLFGIKWSKDSKKLGYRTHHISAMIKKQSGLLLFVSIVNLKTSKQRKDFLKDFLYQKGENAVKSQKVLSKFTEMVNRTPHTSPSSRSRNNMHATIQFKTNCAVSTSMDAEKCEWLSYEIIFAQSHNVNAVWIQHHMKHCFV